jgi:hypothetical protein
MAPGDEEEEHLQRLCQVLNDHEVDYVIFGSFAGRLQGAPLRTVDVVPEMSDANLQRLCDALNSLDPRWRIDDQSDGVRIDGRRLEPRHIRGSSVAIGLVTSAGLVDPVVEPRGFELGFDALIGRAITVDVAGTAIRVGALRDLIVSKQLLGREKDHEHLPLLLEREVEVARERRRSEELSRGPDADQGRGLGL